MPFLDDRPTASFYTESDHHNPLMNIKNKFLPMAMSAVLCGCVTVQGPDNTYRVGAQTTRTDKEGNSERWTPAGEWVSTKLPEAKIERRPVWYISTQESGIKAWRYGFASESNFRYVDPNAPIVSASAFSASGWATYLIKGKQDRDFIVKRVNFSKNAGPETLGVLEGARGDWRFTMGNGEAYSAQSYHLTSKGIILVRSATSFTSLPSRSPGAVLLPEGWSFAWSQKGDLDDTRMLIIKKPDARTLLEPNRFLIGFYDIDKGQIVETIKMNVLETQGTENFSNRLYLLSTANGPLSIAIEDGLKNVTVRNLKTGEKRIAFERDAGISMLQVEQANTGRIAIKAGVGFSDEFVYDAEDFLATGRKAPPTN